jgi:hypothetical protein
MIHADINAIADKFAITDLLHTYCRSLDRYDRESLQSIFHQDSTHVMGGFEGLSIDFCELAMNALDQYQHTHHLLGNILIHLKGDEACAESYFHAYHRVAAETPAAGFIADHTPGLDEDLILAGRYVDRLQRRGSEWKISHRTGILDWCRWEAVSDRGFFSAGMKPYGCRGRADSLYDIWTES